MKKPAKPKARRRTAAGRGEGLRERKRRETRQRILDAGLALFSERGYDTTLEDVAAAAGISRRTFFHYFTSKEEILQAWQTTGFVDAVRAAFAGRSPDEAPFAAVARTLPRVIARFETPALFIVDRLMRSTEALRMRKQGFYLQVEEALAGALRDVWAGALPAATLRLVAVVAVGVMRIASDAWREAGGKRSLAGLVRAGFAAVDPDLFRR